MNNLQLLRHRLRQHLLVVVIVENALMLVFIWATVAFLHLNILLAVIGAAVIAAIAIPLIAKMITVYATEPIAALWQAVLSLQPDQNTVEAPQLDKLRLGQELVGSLVAQIYQYADQAQHAVAATQQQSQSLAGNFVAQNLPLPFLVLDNAETIQFANQAAADYIGITAAELVGKNVYMVLDMSFPNEDTFDTWLKASKQQSATAVRSWERVKLNVRDNHPVRLFDLAAYYNKDNAQKQETMLVLFDHTK